MTTNELSRFNELSRRNERSGSNEYRRRRLFAGLGLALTVLLGGFGVAGAAGSDRAADRPARLYVVQSGDTLWSIARSVQPHGDVRRLVHQLAQQTGGAEISVGSQIELP